MISAINLHLHTIATTNTFVWIFATTFPTFGSYIIAWPNPNTIILQATINVVWFLIIDVYVIELTNSWRIVFSPVFAIVISNVNATIVSVDNVSI